MNKLRLALFSFLVVGSLAAQPIAVGVKGGVPINDPFQTGGSTFLKDISAGSRWTVGPTVELRLPWRLGVEVDAFYRRLNSTSPTASTSVNANSWQFPVLAKWRILPGPIQPYVSGGPVFEWVRGINVSSAAPGATISDDSIVRTGGAIAGGVELHVGRLKISPELRYSRFASESLRTNFQNLLNFQQNEAAFLLGLTF